MVLRPFLVDKVKTLRLDLAVDEGSCETSSAIPDVRRLPTHDLGNSAQNLLRLRMRGGLPIRGYMILVSLRSLVA